MEMNRFTFTVPLAVIVGSALDILLVLVAFVAGLLLLVIGTTFDGIAGLVKKTKDLLQIEIKKAGMQLPKDENFPGGLA